MLKQLLNWRVKDNLNTTDLAIVYKPLALSVMQKKKKAMSLSICLKLEM